MSFLPPKIYIQRLKNILWHFPKAVLNNIRFGFPARKLTIIGITGTDGKTTTCHLIYQSLANSGHRVGLISTTGIKINNQEYPPSLHTTSPDSYYVQKFLSKMVSQKITHVVLEVTAHGIDQYRFWGCHFDVAAITNTSHEHLDDFVNMNTYIKAKSKLFRSAKFAILNHDDPSFSTISSQLQIPFATYGQTPTSTYQLSQITLTSDNLSFQVNNQQYITNSPYLYQTYNILAALAVLN